MRTNAFSSDESMLKFLGEISHSLVLIQSNTDRPRPPSNRHLFAVSIYNREQTRAQMNRNKKQKRTDGANKSEMRTHPGDPLCKAEDGEDVIYCVLRIADVRKWSARGRQFCNTPPARKTCAYNEPDPFAAGFASVLMYIRDVFEGVVNWHPPVQSKRAARNMSESIGGSLGERKASRRLERITLQSSYLCTWARAKLDKVKPLPHSQRIRIAEELSAQSEYFIKGGLIKCPRSGGYSYQRE
ncbi:hypothetical protein GEV33_009821 [Tenebrio molitor]|uniref:Uncharacterized protein n=1 Tax=Tenebrio molitor TaxID=7067 RepID=A0A8J6HE37_TENMO|nr:hypothetical protein GEV33_009821 [Tenebrio molitor]